MKFLILLIVINATLFLPRYLLGLPKQWNPLRFITSNDPIKYKLRTIYFSRVIDPFRLSLEYSIAVLLVYLLGLQSGMSTWVLTIIALVVFVFNIYSAVFLVLLKKTPILRSDWYFLKESVSIYEGYFSLIIILTATLLGLLGSMFYYLNIQFCSLNK